VGRTPHQESDLTVEHVTHHHRWSPERTVFGACPVCDGELALLERQVLVTFGDDGGADGDRRYGCSERCLAEWVGDAA
jgi:hypothetical protein